MEDGAVLGRLLGSVTRASVAEIPRVLQRFQALRKQRVEEIAKQALKQVRHALPANVEHSLTGLRRDGISTCQMGRSRKPEIGPWLEIWFQIASILVDGKS